MKKLSMQIVAAAMMLAMAAPSASCEVKLPTLISDGMVIQRDAPVKLWGEADPGETVSVSVVNTKKKSKKYKEKAVVAADSAGHWEATIKALPVGGLYDITINDIKIGNVVAGDVFLCSGQSNMELPVRRVTDMFADEVESYSNADIRHFRVPNVTEFHQKNDNLGGGSWVSLDPESAMNFSALAYFLSRELYDATQVPIGIINASWGGTPIESWIAEDWLSDFPRALAQKKIYDDDQYRKHVKQLEGENYYRWERTMDASDPGLQQAEKWYSAAYDDTAWADMDLLSTEWGSDGYLPINGSHWFRKHFAVSPQDAGKEGVLRLGCIVDADSAYVNGVFVGNITYQYPPRIYQVPAGVLKEGDNTVTVRVISQHGLPHFVPEKPYKLIVGDNEYDLQGTWKYRMGAVMPEGPDMAFYHYMPAVLYNAMIHPVRNYTVKGAVWYQGESNVGRHYEYEKLLPTMIGNWRDAFGQDMPFYVVELADFLHPRDRQERAKWALLRQAQAKGAEAAGNAVLIKNSDLGEWNDIHPLDKKTLAKRIADEILK